MTAQPHVLASRVAHWPRTSFGGFWRRVGAAIVDSVILYFPPAIVKVLLGLPLLATSSGPDVAKELLVNLGSLIMLWLYCALLESSSRQATLGQQLLGLQVMDLEARRISFARASGRYFAQFLSALLCGVGYLFNLWTSRRQTLHDLVAGCVIVIAERAPRTAPAQAGELG
ncbi:MAG: RDD family protein [Candidatus Eisenbacteria bacterium]